MLSPWLLPAIVTIAASEIRRLGVINIIKGDGTKDATKIQDQLVRSIKGTAIWAFPVVAHLITASE
jgi:hypothetical protein